MTEARNTATGEIAVQEVTVHDPDGDMTFRVNETGIGRERVIVFLHGSGPGADALSNWEWVIGELDGEFHCIAPDVIGFGHSTHPDPPPMGLKAFTELRVRTLIALFDTLQLQRVTLVGNSMGGLLALMIAARRPEMVDGLILMGSAGGKAPMLDGLKRLIGFYDDPTAANMETLMRGFLHDPSVFGDDLGAIAAARIPNAVRPEVRRSHLATFAPDGGRAGLTMDEYASLAMPVLLLHGDDDQVVSIESSRWLDEQLPNSRLEVFPATGHWLQIERGPEFVGAVRSFVGAHGEGEH